MKMLICSVSIVLILGNSIFAKPHAPDDQNSRSSKPRDISVPREVSRSDVSELEVTKPDIPVVAPISVLDVVPVAIHVIPPLGDQKITIRKGGGLQKINIDDPEIVLARSAPGNLLLGGGFEYPDQKGAAYVPHGKGPLGAWVIENGTVDIVGPYWRASRGKQSLDLSGMQEMPGTISQEIETNPNEYYKIRFVVAANPEPADRINLKKMKVFWGDKELRTITVSAKRHDFHNVGWKIYEFTVRGTEDLSKLKFQSLTNTPCGPILDDISVSHLPNHKPTK